MYNSSRVTEIEHHSASACGYEESNIEVSSSSSNGEGQWQEEEESSSSSVLPVVKLKSGTTIRVSPIERKCGGWDNEHFHENLKLPSDSNYSLGMVVTLEAMGRECIAIALSPKPFFVMGKTYVVHFGAGQNLSTVLRRRLPNGSQSVDISFPTPRICDEYSYQKYWVILQLNGQLSAGIGPIPGRQCVGTLDDQLYHYLRSGVDAVQYVGIGNSSLSKQARDIKVRNVRVSSIPPCFLVDKGIPLAEMTTTATTTTAAVGSAREAEEQKLWAEYVAECNKAKARALKFGTEYTQPSPDAFFKWSEARRLRSNPERGFITGLDTFSKEEQLKAAKRKQRFQEEEEEYRVKHGASSMEEENTTQNTSVAVDEEEQEQVNKKSKEPWNVEQAWDNERKVRKFRTDPPSSMLLCDQNDDQMNHSIDNVKWVPEKIHIFAIDWAAFKQIRTDDLMSYFSIYGPTYVEWLGELSCNILFEDKYSAARALAAMSQEIPTFEKQNNNSMAEEEISEDIQKINENKPDLGALGWRFCNFPVRKVMNDRFGRKGTRSRLLMRLATALDVLDEKPKDRSPKPPGFSTTRILGPHVERRRNQNKAKKQGKRRKIEDEEIDDNGGHSALDRELSSTRAGFSIEELEKERNANAKKESTMQEDSPTE